MKRTNVYLTEKQLERLHLQAQQETTGAEQTRLQARTQELQTRQAEVEQEVKRLTEALAEETRRRPLTARLQKSSTGCETRRNAPQKHRDTENC